jgi:hypothetical protein
VGTLCDHQWAGLVAAYGQFFMGTDIPPVPVWRALVILDAMSFIFAFARVMARVENLQNDRTFCDSRAVKSAQSGPQEHHGTEARSGDGSYILALVSHIRFDICSHAH